MNNPASRIDFGELTLLTVVSLISAIFLLQAVEYDAVTAAGPAIAIGLIAISVLFIVFGETFRRLAERIPGYGGEVDDAGPGEGVEASDEREQEDDWMDLSDTNSEDDLTLSLPLYGPATVPFEWITASLVVVFVGLGFTVGLIWGTLAFALLYAYLSGMDRRDTAILLGATLFTLYVFGVVLGIPLSRVDVGVPL